MAAVRAGDSAPAPRRHSPFHVTSLLGPSAAHAQQPVLSRGQGIAPSFVAHRGPLVRRDPVAVRPAASSQSSLAQLFL
jgi:hypothetical protein